MSYCFKEVFTNYWRGQQMRYKWFLSVLILILTTGLPLLAVAASVQIEEWDVPTANSFPHDPAVAPDGSLWFTGMSSNTLGRLDPKTGKIREYPLNIPSSGPHGLVADREGNIWFTANFKGYIGKLDPRTGKVKDYPMPDPAARDPHTLISDSAGILWFTVQGGNFVGRLDPGTGTIRLKRSPTPNSKPYGIVINTKGIPFFCEFGTNKLASIHPGSMEITEVLLPEGARPRRLAVGQANRIFYTDYARGYLGRLDPERRKVEEWASPGGPESKPYGIAATPDGMIWYSESGVRPDTILRFDPKTKTFNTWPIPSGGGVIRHMVATPVGDVYIACSGVNKVGIVRVQR
jgi:virginiamycin B lyase